MSKVGNTLLTRLVVLWWCMISSQCRNQQEQTPRVPVYEIIMSELMRESMHVYVYRACKILDLCIHYEKCFTIIHVHMHLIES